MSEQNPHTLIVGELLERLHHRPFKPFDIVLSHGARHHVPTADHLTIPRIVRRVLLDFDDGSFATINPLHIASLEPAKTRGLTRDKRRPKKAA